MPAPTHNSEAVAFAPFMRQFFAMRHATVKSTRVRLPPGVALPTFVREVRAGLLGLPFSFGWKAFHCLLEYGQWHTKLHHEFTSSPHWFLATIGVDPACQGKGIGGALLEAITIKADQQHLPCYLETHGEKSARLYERHGFETVRLFEVPGHTVPVWAMLRPARNA
jgi:GNAT superfamily N-acetyltransferase